MCGALLISFPSATSCSDLRLSSSVVAMLALTSTLHVQTVPGTAMRVGGEARPMTSVAGAGYQSNRQGTFDPLNQNHGPASALAERADNGPEHLAKEMERQVHSRQRQNKKRYRILKKYRRRLLTFRLHCFGDISLF